jgi:hypothetical protein
MWLRWRLLVNQWRRAGAFNAILMMVLFIGALVTAIPLFIACLGVGMYLVPQASPAQLMYAWDALILAFLLWWMIGLLVDLQRSDPLSLSKFLHLPVSVNGAFLINYFSSLTRMSLFVFGPVMLAFSLALIFTKGWVMLPVLPLLAGFIFMISALTYQFQGWLALLMSNPRRRRSIIVGVTMAFVLVFQLPQLVNFMAPWGFKQQQERAAKLKQQTEQLNREAATQKLSLAELQQRQKAISDTLARSQAQATRDFLKRLDNYAQLANVVLPIGWLPVGVMTAAEGSIWPSLLGLVGLTFLGSASLWRAYGTTVRIYQGQSSNSTRRPAPKAVVASAPSAGKRRASLLEAKLPGVSEPVSAVALAGFRSLVRAPEARMMLLGQLIMLVVLGTLVLRQGQMIPTLARPLVAMGGMLFILFGSMNVMANQFGFDRDGFRVFVLSAARRRDILFGKNLAFAPVALGLAFIGLIVAEIFSPMRVDQVLAMLPQFVSMYLVFCIFANLCSIFAPTNIPAGALRPSNPKLTIVLIQLLVFLVAFPLAEGLLFVPLAVDAALRVSYSGVGALPNLLLFNLLECAIVMVIYDRTLRDLGNAFQSREQRILEVVTGRKL